MPDPETPQGETLDPQAQGITEQPTTDSTAVEESEAPVEKTDGGQDEVISKKEYEKLQMELAQKRNALEKYEKQKEEARLAELSEVERLREELAQREAQDEQREAEALRNKFIEEYGDEKVAAAAKKLVSENPANLSWGEVSTEDEAKAAIHRQMDAIKAILPAAAEDDEPTGEITANNPEYRIGDVDITKLSAEEMRKVLPIAPPR